MYRKKSLAVDAGHELQLTERVRITEDGKKPIYAHEIFPGGRTVKHEDEFEVG